MVYRPCIVERSSSPFPSQLHSENILEMILVGSKNNLALEYAVRETHRPPVKSIKTRSFIALC